MSFLVNQSTSSCCGKPSEECTCGGHRSAVANADKPQPMPSTDWQQVFNQTADQQPAQHQKGDSLVNEHKPTPMPTTDWPGVFAKSA
jgi:hypothetical protein